jgi:hypothetical protein
LQYSTPVNKTVVVITGILHTAVVDLVSLDQTLFLHLFAESEVITSSTAGKVADSMRVIVSKSVK